MSETLQGMIGKSFEYEERVQVKSLTETISGTIAVFVGAANWGPVGVPTMVTSDFEGTFGTSVIKDDEADFSGLAATYTLEYAPYLWFTRVTNGLEEKATYNIVKDAVAAVIEGTDNLRDSTFVLYPADVTIYETDYTQNNLIELSVIDSANPTGTPVSTILDGTSSCTAVTSSAVFPDAQSDSSVVQTNGNYSVAAVMTFQIDSVDYRHIVSSEFVDGTRNPDTPDFLNLIVPLTGDYDSTYTGGNDAAATFSDTILNAAVEEVLVELVADNTGIAGNDIVLTGNVGGDDLDALISAWNSSNVGNEVSLAGTTLGTIVPGDGEIMQLSGGLDVLSWADYTPAAGVETYAERFVYALKKYVVEPKLTTTFTTLDSSEITAIADVLVTVDVDDNVVISSIKKGLVSVIKVFSIPKIFTATTSSPIVSTGTNTTTELVLAQINDDLPDGAIVYLDAEYYTFQLLATNAGIDYGVAILETDPDAANIYSDLGIEVTDITLGTDAIADAGTLTAAYSGSDGNTIQLTKYIKSDGYALSITFQGYAVATFFNYSYDTTSANFLGTLIANDDAAAAVVSLTVDADVEVMPSLPYGTITLGGGVSGLSSISDVKYNVALAEYKNIDLYTMDIICVSGHTSESVQDQIQAVCEYRKDCFGIIDAPETVAGIEALGGSPTNMIAWHNGLGDHGRDNALDSKYVCTYFPWMSIDDGTDDAESTWYAPSVRAVGAIAACDKIKGHKFAAPAGNLNAPITSINSLAQYMKEDDKQKVYADELDNNINPIVYTTTRGFFLDGQKNCEKEGTALSRLNVMRTNLYIKKRIYELTPNFFWKPLTQGTMDDLAYALRTIGTYLSSNEVQAMKTDFVVTVDSTINTEITEAQRGLIGIIEWTPIRSIEKIKIISVINDYSVTVTYA